MQCKALRLILPTDDSHTVYVKKILTAGGVVNIVICAFYLFIGGPPVLQLRRLAVMTSSLLLFFQLMVEKKVRYGLVEILMYVLSALFLMSDLMMVTSMKGGRAWPFFVILIDLCLVCHLPTRVTNYIVVCLMMWLGCLAFEGTYRFGLFDLAFLTPQEDRRAVVDCATLPCPLYLGSSLTMYADQCMVFLLDFYFTRSFSSNLRREHDKMNKVIVTTEDIATSLSRFDLEVAEAILSTSSLPPPLYDAFSSILENLEMYRPYLPDALFHSMHSEGKRRYSEVTAPGLKSEKATLVFTDIQGSTATWEACPEGMKEGLQVHNQAIRDCIAEHNGYEVKTIGDSFMVAFESASDAVWFGLSVQERLVNSVWPEELLDTVDHCSWDAEGPWCGLRVRVGVHCGDVSVQLNNLTGRYDYFGNTVNKAARMEGVCVGGAVAVTPEVMEAVGPLDSVSVIPMGQTELKGVASMVYPSMLLPEAHRERRLFIEQQLLLKRRDRKLGSKVYDEPERQSQPGSLYSFHNDDPTLASTCATVAKVEIVLMRYKSGSEVGSAMNTWLSKTLTCTERSHGAVVSLQGNRIAVSWNCTKPCPTHVENSLVFVKTLGVSADLGDDASIHVGMSTSTMFHGTVGNKRQLFVTVLGTGVVVSSSLCCRAESHGVLCYYATPFPTEARMEGLRILDTGFYETDGTKLRLLDIDVDIDVNATGVF